MKDKKRTLRKTAAIVTGTFVTGALASLSTQTADAANTDLFEFSSMGSGAEVRSQLLDVNIIPGNTFELKCGNKESKKEEKGKTSEGKCGEGKCGVS